MEKIIAIDVDLTVVDTVSPWKDWYHKLTGHDIGEISSENNDLETLMKRHDDPLKFWRDPKLYDDLMALEPALYFIEKIHDLGVKVVFVSACMPEHESSKKFFLRRNFPYMEGFISTADKRFVKCDYFVDDYRRYCDEMYEEGVNVFQIKTSLNSPSDKYPYCTWDVIYEMIKEDLGVK